MQPNRVHLIAHGNPLGPDLKLFGLRSVEDYVAFAREHLPRPLRLTCHLPILKAVEEPRHGGRRDDAARIRDLQGALDDPRTIGIVAASGGAYFSRILPHLDFSALARRREPFWALGFSEMTTLVNLVARYRCGRGMYWLCPNWLGSRIKPVAAARAALAEFWGTLGAFCGTPGESCGISRASVGEISNTRATALEQWSFRRQAQRPDAAAHRSETGATTAHRSETGATNISALGRDENGRYGEIVGRVVAGTVRPGRIRIVGGCLAVLAAVVGGDIGRRLRPRGQWLMLEDVKETPYRIDRHLATLKVAGWFERIGGLIIGDFHALHEDTQPAVLELLKYHLPADRHIPVVATRSVGHVWPMVPVVLNRVLSLVVRDGGVHIRSSSCG